METQTAGTTEFSIKRPYWDEKEVHLPRFMPFFWLGLASLVGPPLASWLKLHWGWWFGIGLLFLIGLLVVMRLKPAWGKIGYLPIPALLVSCCLTAGLYVISTPTLTPEHLRYYNDQGAAAMTGVICAPPEVRGNRVSLRVCVRSFAPQGKALREVRAQDIHGTLLLQTSAKPDYHYGDLLLISGEVETPPEGTSFSWREHLQHKGIYSFCNYAKVEILARNKGSLVLNAIFRVLERAKLVVNSLFPAPENALLAGILLGDDSGMPKELKDAYILTGTAHIIAISGFNMAVLSTIVSYLVTRRWGPYIGSAVTIVVMIFYGILVGSSASVVRAAIMSGYGLISAAIGRRGALLNGLGLCVLLMVVFDPHIVWDVGFQLSGTATLGLVLFMPPITARLQNNLEEEPLTAFQRIWFWLREFFLITLAAQLMTLPILLFHFRTLSPLFLIANPLVLPFQPLVMVASLAAVFFGMFSLPLGQVFAWIGWLPAALTNTIVQWLADIFPYTLKLPRFNAVWVVCYYLIVFAVVLSKTKEGCLFKRFLAPYPLMALLLTLCLVLGAVIAAKPTQKLEMRLYSANGEPVLFVRTPDGYNLLIGTSLLPLTVQKNLDQALSEFARSLDIVVVTDCRRQGVKSLSGLLDLIVVRQVYWACSPNHSQTTQNLFERFSTAGVQQHLIEGVHQMDAGTGLRLEIRSVSTGLEELRINHAAFSFILLPDKTTSQYSDVLPTVLITKEKGSQGKEVVITLSEASPDLIVKTPFENFSLGDKDWVEMISNGREIRVSFN